MTNAAKLLSVVMEHPGMFSYNMTYQPKTVTATPTTIWLICATVITTGFNHLGFIRTAMRK